MGRYKIWIKANDGEPTNLKLVMYLPSKIYVNQIVQVTKVIMMIIKYETLTKIPQNNQVFAHKVNLTAYLWKPLDRARNE